MQNWNSHVWFSKFFSRTIALTKSEYYIPDGTDMAPAEIYEILKKIGIAMTDFGKAF